MLAAAGWTKRLSCLCKAERFLWWGGTAGHFSSQVLTWHKTHPGRHLTWLVRTPAGGAEHLSIDGSHVRQQGPVSNAVGWERRCITYSSQNWHGFYSVTSGNSLTHVLWLFISHSRLCGKGELSHSRCQCQESYGSWCSAETHALPSSTPGHPAIPLIPMPSADQKQWAKASQIPQERSLLQRNTGCEIRCTSCQTGGKGITILLFGSTWLSAWREAQRSCQVTATEIRAKMIPPQRKRGDTKWPCGFVVSCSAFPTSFQHHIGQTGTEQNLAFPRDVLHEIRCSLTWPGLIPLLFRTDK